ncbi:hypothetical protein OHS33_15320 [Streptomyces sp. NBC_00536]|uniref:hypothetical protein n=1 Tax=Streptomyces sp. NBC_00536 TaxID=2975769 RepID=UPI002E81DC87|nr:hypothetical protein [Streptomyces sp. NBC_00536]WUC79574.1 hypothetical protein OHS33_15320 [Streptomyces sp. NBC_00536]
MSTETDTADTEDLLRSVLSDLAAAVPDGSTTSYRKEQARWRRREYRRRCVVAALVLLVVGIVCAIGLMTLSNASPDTHVIFTNGTPANPAPEVGAGR